MLVRTNIYLPKSTLDQLKRRAKEQKTTVSELVRKSLEKDQHAYPKVNAAEGLLRLAEKLTAGYDKENLHAQPIDYDYEIYVKPYEREQKEFLEEMKSKQKK